MAKNWSYVLTFPEVSLFMIDALKKGVLMSHICQELSEGSQESVGFLFPDGSKDIMQQLRAQLRRAEKWEKKTSLEGVAEKDKLTVIQARLQRCAFGDRGDRFSWEIFLQDGESRAYVVSRLKDMASQKMRPSQALESLALELSKGAAKRPLLTLGLSVRRTSQDPLRSLIEYLEK
jgi:hypothetical protein